VLHKRREKKKNPKINKKNKKFHDLSAQGTKKKKEGNKRYRLCVPEKSPYQEIK